MITAEYTVLASEGLHARPAKAFLQTIRPFESNIMIAKDTIESNARSMLEILSMQASYNSKVTIKIEGEDEEDAAKAVEKFFTEDIIKL